MKIRVSDSFFPLLKNTARYLIMFGGGGSGKSEFAGRKVFYRCINEGGHRFLIMRKIRNRLGGSVIRVMTSILNENHVAYKFNQSDRVITFRSRRNGKLNELLFDGLDDPEKIKSIKDITNVWLEETTEFTERDFEQINLRLRGETPFYKQIMMTFNPDESVGKWLKNMFGVTPGNGKRRGSFVHQSTIADNPIDVVRAEYTDILDELTDPTMRDIYRFGLWAKPAGQIFDWPVVQLPEFMRFDEIWYGLDFGFSVDPAALVKIYRKADHVWLQTLIYETKLTNDQLAEKIIDSGYEYPAEIYADSAEPKSIAEIAAYRGAGGEKINIKPAAKGADSVRAGLKFMAGLKIHIIDTPDELTCDPLEDETASYKWKTDKNGETLSVPVDRENHAVDGSRYGLFTHLKARRRGYVSASTNFYDNIDI